MLYEEKVAEDLQGHIQHRLEQLEARNIQVRLRKTDGNQHSFRLNEGNKGAKLVHNSPWEKPIVDEEMGFAIRGEDEYRTGFDRLKKWDAIIREQELEDKTRRGELNLTEKFLMEMNAGRGLLSKALFSSDEEKIVSMGQNDECILSMVSSQRRDNEVMEQIKTAIHKSWKRREIPSQSRWNLSSAGETASHYPRSSSDFRVYWEYSRPRGLPSLPA